MKLLPILGATTLALASACQSQGPYVNKHWSERSVGPSMARAFLSYNPEFDGSYRDFAWKKKQDIDLTVRRHLFNNNPDNPFQPDNPSSRGPRPINSPLPHPENYIHYEGLALGVASLGVGNFTPLPIDSIIGTFEPGGGREFEAGFDEFFRPLGIVTTSFLYDAIGFDRGQEGQEMVFEICPGEGNTLVLQGTCDRKCEGEAACQVQAKCESSCEGQKAKVIFLAEPAKH